MDLQLRPLGANATHTHTPTLTLPMGGAALVRITVVTTRSLPETVLRVEIPAGARVVDPGVESWTRAATEYGTPRFPRLPVLDGNLRGSTLWLHLDALEPGIHEHHLALQATTGGSFRCAPATLLRAADSTPLTTAESCRSLVVTPRRRTTPKYPSHRDGRERKRLKR